jgi:hypothetical protein
MGKCYFCGKNESIKNSHIIPAFIINWLKNTSLTKHIRSSVNANRRVQDGEKLDLLCNTCENDFSKNELRFKDNIFVKIANYQNQKENISITEFDRKCIYSIIWRIITATYYYKLDYLSWTDEEKQNLNRYSDILKKAYLNGESDEIRTHLIPLTLQIVRDANFDGEDMLFYERSIGYDIKIWDNFKRLVVYLKLPFMIIICELINNKNDIWLNTQVEKIDKINIKSKYLLPEYVTLIVNDAYDKYCKNASSVIFNEKTIKIIENSLKGCENSGTIKSINKNIRGIIWIDNS